VVQIKRSEMRQIDDAFAMGSGYVLTSSHNVKLALDVKKTGAKPKPSHRSKKDQRSTWTSRGSMPWWMRGEMKALKLKLEAFSNHEVGGFGWLLRSLLSS
jgi:DNA-binding protein H-NS